MSRTTTRKRSNTNSGLTAEAVEAYLREHPKYFEEHLELLETLKVPHPCGDAVSLVARQLSLIREKNNRLQQQLNDIVQIARENDVLNQRIHQLTLTLLAAMGLPEALSGLEKALHQHFQTDFVAVRLAAPRTASAAANLWMAPGSSGSELLATTLDTGEPHCGKPDPDQARFLFGEQGAEVASFALIPLQHADLRGLLAIGSRDTERFQPGLGYLFLSQMGEILSARLYALVGGGATD